MSIVDILPLTGLPVVSFLQPAEMHVKNNNALAVILFILNVPFRCRRTVPGSGCPGTCRPAILRWSFLCERLFIHSENAERFPHRKRETRSFSEYSLLNPAFPGFGQFVGAMLNEKGMIVKHERHSVAPSAAVHQSRPGSIDIGGDV